MMHTWLDPNYPDSFLMFSTPHLSAILALITLAVSMYLLRLKIRSNRTLHQSVKYVILLALILPELSLNYWYLLEDIWDARQTLPLELCSITLILSVVMLITESKTLYHVTFFAGIGGALQAILTPNLGYPFPHFRFFHFFIVHIAIILASLYMTWIENYKPSWKSIGFTLLFLNLLLIIVGSVNYVLQSNYMFLMHKPSTPSLLDVLGPYPYYLISEEIIALVIFSFMYFIFFCTPLKYFKKSYKRNR